MTRSTIADVAQRAGVSKKTVSFVVNGSGPVAAATRARVEAAVRELGYVADPQARALAGGRSALILVVHDDCHDDALVQLLNGLATDHGGAGPALGVERNLGRDSIIAMLGNRRPQGVVLLPPLSTDTSLVRACEDMGCRVVAIIPMARDIDDGGSGLIVDERRAMADATNWLIAQGHRRIGFIAGPDHDPCALARELGFMDAMADTGLERGAEIVAQGDFSAPSGEAAGALLLQVSPRPSAILAANDAMAAGAMRAARASGLNIPRDLSVMGFGDAPGAMWLDPPLATMRLEWTVTGQMAARMLDMPGASSPLPIASELVARGSVQPAAE